MRHFAEYCQKVIGGSVAKYTLLLPCITASTVKTEKKELLRHTTERIDRLYSTKIGPKEAVESWVRIKITNVFECSKN